MAAADRPAAGAPVTGRDAAGLLGRHSGGGGCPEDRGQHRGYTFDPRQRSPIHQSLRIGHPAEFQHPFEHSRLEAVYGEDEDLWLFLRARTGGDQKRRREEARHDRQGTHAGKDISGIRLGCTVFFDLEHVRRNQ